MSTTPIFRFAALRFDLASCLLFILNQFDLTVGGLGILWALRGPLTTCSNRPKTHIRALARVPGMSASASIRLLLLPCADKSMPSSVSRLNTTCSRLQLCSIYYF